MITYGEKLQKTVEKNSCESKGKENFSTYPLFLFPWLHSIFVALKSMAPIRIHLLVVFRLGRRTTPCDFHSDIIRTEQRPTLKAIIPPTIGFSYANDHQTILRRGDSFTRAKNKTSNVSNLSLIALNFVMKTYEYTICLRTPVLPTWVHIGTPSEPAPTNTLEWGHARCTVCPQWTAIRFLAADAEQTPSPADDTSCNSLE